VTADAYLDIAKACPVEYYLAGSDGCRIEWPYRLQPADESYPRYAEQADRYIVDSAISNPDVGTRETLDKAEYVDADVAVLEDVYQDFDATVDSVLEGMAVADDHAFGGELLVPLQEPHVECWREVGEPDHVAVGGVKDAPASEKVRVTQQVRDAVGPDVWVHGLGFGATDAVVHAVRSDPDLLDSIDSYSPLQNVDLGTIWPGDERGSVKAIRALAELVESCRRMTPSCTGTPDDAGATHQASLF